MASKKIKFPGGAQLLKVSNAEINICRDYFLYA
jgi:hypothetical protein